MGVRNPEPVVIDWSFRPAARISVVTSSIIRWPANSSARLFRPSFSRVGGGEVAFAADRVTMPGIPQKEPRLWIRAFNDEKGLQCRLQFNCIQVCLECNAETLLF